MALDLQIASINGIEFYAFITQEEAGIKTATYELPNGGRFVDFIGKYQPIYNISGEIEVEKWNELANILDTEATINLTLPASVGDHSVISKIVTLDGKYKATPFNEERISLVKFEATFIVSQLSVPNNNNALPTQSDLNTNKANILQNALSIFVNAYEVTTDTLTSAVNKIETVNQYVSDAIRVANAIPNAITDLGIAIQNVQQSIGSLIQTPTNLAISMQNIMTTFGTIGSTAADQLSMAQNVIANLFTSPFSSGKSQIQNNLYYVNNVVENFIWTSAMLTCIDSIIQNTYTNLSNAQNDQNFLIIQYSNLRLITDLPTRTLFENQFNKTNIILNQTILTLKNQQSYNYSYYSPLTACYEIYGSIDKVNDLISANYVPDPSYINQEIVVIL